MIIFENMARLLIVPFLLILGLAVAEGK